MSKHGLRFRVVEMTPKLAQKYLEKNESNRNLRPKKVAEYRRQMEKGYWHLTPQGISISPEGKLINGQHRLHAVIAFGEAVPMVVTTGVPHEAQQYMDTGVTRRIYDALKMFDNEKNAHQLTAMSRAIQLFDTGRWDTVLLDDVRATIKLYRESFDWVQELPSKQLPRSSYFLGALAWIHHHGWAAEVEMFAHEMATLEGLSKGSPVIALQRAVARLAATKVGKWRSVGMSMMTFSGLRAYVEEEAITSRHIHANTVGFDYFNTIIKTVPKRRSSGTCKWKAGCVFPLLTERECWLHSNFKTKRNYS